MRYKDNWEETKSRFVAWWRHSRIDRPMMRVIGRLEDPVEPLEIIEPPRTPMEYHLDVDRKVKELRNFCRTHLFLAESFPSLNINIGPGSMATYLGSEPVFSWDTVWYTPCVTSDWSDWGPLRYDEDNYWWKLHLSLIRKAKELAGDDFLVNIPDIIESIDILSSLRGAQKFIYDLIDSPDIVKKYIKQTDELYFKYYDAMYEIVKCTDGSSSYTVFDIWGPGKTAKVQCDFSAVMSPKQFHEFFIPSLTYQCNRLDYVLYHLDGPDAIKHLPAILKVEKVNAIQWTPGAGKPDGGSEDWYPVYDMVRNAGKSLWISIEEGNFDDWIKKADKIVKRYGADGLYLLFPITELEVAEELIRKAEMDWR
ncbi:MAG TPA: trimethylamine corrinoid protein 2 [bacterium]|nr:trimethylamine corrinoid protein 2 [bacterium]